MAEHAEAAAAAAEAAAAEARDGCAPSCHGAVGEAQTVLMPRSCMAQYPVFVMKLLIPVRTHWCLRAALLHALGEFTRGLRRQRGAIALSRQRTGVAPSLQPPLDSCPLEEQPATCGAGRLARATAEGAALQEQLAMAQRLFELHTLPYTPITVPHAGWRAPGRRPRRCRSSWPRRSARCATSATRAPRPASAATCCRRLRCARTPPWPRWCAPPLPLYGWRARGWCSGSGATCCRHSRCARMLPWPRWCVPLPLKHMASRSWQELGGHSLQGK